MASLTQKGLNNFMDKDKPAIDVVPVAAPVVDDIEAKVAALEAEKAKIIVERENYKIAFLKEKNKGNEDVVLDDDERMTQVAQKVLADSRLAEIAREQDEIIRKALKENKELKLARSKTNEPPAAIGSHSESIPVRDTSITAEQLMAFKSRGWTEKDIERYKKNLQKYSGR